MVNYDHEYHGLQYYYCNVKRYLDADVLFYIISYLDMTSTNNLAMTSKLMYSLCRSNYVWRKMIFNCNALSEKIINIVYEKNRYYFSDYYYFKKYYNISFDCGSVLGKYNYFDMFINIIKLAPDLRAPYYHREIIPDIYKIHRKMIQDGGKYEEFLYTVKVVPNLIKYNNRACIWKYEKITDNSHYLLVLRATKTGIIKFQKYIKPFYVPDHIIGNVKILFFNETIIRLFS